MTETRESLGSLSTIVRRKTFTIESKKHPKGKIYDVASSADFGPYEYALLVEKQNLARELQTKKRLTAAQKARLDEALNDVVKMLLPTLEASVLAEMTEQQKTTLVLTWITSMTQEASKPGNRQARRQAAKKPTSRRPTGSR